MALTACPICTHQVSEQAPFCPSCGHPIAAASGKAAGGRGWAGVFGGVAQTYISSTMLATMVVGVALLVCAAAVLVTLIIVQG